MDRLLRIRDQLLAAVRATPPEWVSAEAAQGRWLAADAMGAPTMMFVGPTVFMQELRKFVAPEFIYGRGATALVGRYAVNFGARRLLVVTDPGVMAAGLTRTVIEQLESEPTKAHAI